MRHGQGARLWAGEQAGGQPQLPAALAAPAAHLTQPPSVSSCSQKKTQNKNTNDFVCPVGPPPVNTSPGTALHRSPLHACLLHCLPACVPCLAFPSLPCPFGCPCLFVFFCANSHSISSSICDYLSVCCCPLGGCYTSSPPGPTKQGAAAACKAGWRQGGEWAVQEVPVKPGAAQFRTAYTASI